MPRPVRVSEEHSPRTKLVLATLDLLRRGGLSGAGINQVVATSRAPKGSVYHYIPGGKQQLVIEALREAERTVGERGAKVRTLFNDALGPFYCRLDESGLVIGLRVAPKHANARGLAHGGFLLTLCDIALGYSAAHSQDPPLALTTAHISADFAGSARVGDWLESRADIQRIGGRLAFVNVYLVAHSNRIVRASGVYLRSERDPQGGQPA